VRRDLLKAPMVSLEVIRSSSKNVAAGRVGAEVVRG